MSFILECPTSSPSQNVNWYPSEYNVSFGKYENTNQWYSNLSWTVMNDTHGNWTAVLVRFSVSHKSAIAPELKCFLYPKNQTDLTLNISAYGFRYPDYLFLLQISGFPFTQDALSIMETYEPNLSTTSKCILYLSGKGFIVISNTATTLALCKEANDRTISNSERRTGGGSVAEWLEPWTCNSEAPSSSPALAASWVSSSNPRPRFDLTGLTGFLVISRTINVLVFDWCGCNTVNQSRSIELFIFLFITLEFEYHAFIIYNKEDSSWVVRKLLPLLEDKHHLKCCVHYRDFEPGKPFHDIMAETVYKSYKIIAVLSSNFLKSNYCNYELNLAKYRLVHRADNSLIMIRIDDADSKKLPRTLRKRNFIDYCNVLERPFWEEKLLRFLNVQNEDGDNRSAIAVQNQDVDNNEAEGSAFPSFNSIELRKNFNRLNSTTSNNTEVSLVSLPNEELNLEV
ncbi:unnamed protein product [Porites lobata]|uniref:TIR domain-containing protein n=1 Tax=Porites lobata TaxID=104759 RepID=A0ABN8Q3S4_9CNID|nr:unnamed protein product [Porites lobata]